MATNPLALLAQRLRRSARPRDGAAQTDGQLLEAFLRGHDGLALEVLVRRHAPMVWGVCRRTLAHQDAEDAFQATFLVLVRKAASLRSRDLLPNWLYRVACQTARKARQMAAKRQAREKQLRVLPEPPRETHDDPFGPELRALLDEELGRLPEKYRIAVVLCDVEGRTRHEAAQELRLPEGTVASRQARGRALLAKRLLKRGLSVSATSLAAGFQQAALGAVPAPLLSHTVQVVQLVAAGEVGAAGLISTRVSALAERVLRAMAVAKQRVVGAWLVLAAFVLAGGLAGYHTLAAPVPASGTANSSLAAGRRAPLAPAYSATGEVWRFGVEEYAWSVSFSPDGRQVLIGTGGSNAPVRVCDLRSGQELLRTDPYPSCWSAAYSPDGQSIVIGLGARRMQIVDARSLKVCRELPGRGARNVTYSPDGRLIASGHADSRLRLWDVTQGRILHAFPAANGAVHCAAFTPDGQHLLVIDPDRTLRLYEVGSGREVRRFEGHTARVIDVAVSADGERGLSCSGDGTVRVWDLATGMELLRLAQRDGPHGVAFCPDGRRALSAGNETVHLWDLTTGRQLQCFVGHQGAVVCVAVSPGGRYAVSGSSDHTVRLWRLPAPTPSLGP